MRSRSRATEILLLVAACHARPTTTVKRFVLRDGVSVAFYHDTKTQLGFVRIGDFTSGIWPSWTAMAADLDGDGHDELLLGIWSNTHRHDEPDPHKTIWVMHWDGTRLVSLFRASAFTAPLLDASVVRGAPDELSTLERDPDGHCARARYHWNGFGFDGVAREPARCQE